ncbi:hypothetical protein EV368DRAFT_67235 [Lentinula lateritia]|nr:hypothetical protein EV368DRAFT_67235 [Lentinula lateritia]
MRLLFPSTKLYFTLWMGALFLVPTMAVPIDSPPYNPLMSGGLSASHPDPPNHNKAYDQVINFTDVNIGLNPTIEARLWVHPEITDYKLPTRTAVSWAVQHMMEPIRSTILKDIHEDDPSLGFLSSTPVLVHHMSGKLLPLNEVIHFEISFSGDAKRKKWSFATPGSADPSYFGHFDSKCLFSKADKSGLEVKKELITGKISRRYPGKNEEVLVSFENGKFVWSEVIVRDKTWWGEFFLKCIMYGTREEFYSALFMSILFLVPIMAVPVAPQDPKEMIMYLMSGGLSPDAPNTPHATNATTNAAVQHVEEDDHGHIHNDPYPVKGTLYVHSSLFEPDELRNVMKNAIQSMLIPIIPDLLAAYEQNSTYLKPKEPPTGIPLTRVFALPLPRSLKSSEFPDIYDFRLKFSQNPRTYFGNIDKKCLILEKDNDKGPFEFQPGLLTGKIGEDARLKERLLVSFVDGKTVEVAANTGFLSRFKAKLKLGKTGKGPGSPRSLYEAGSLYLIVSESREVHHVFIMFISREVDIVTVEDERDKALMGALLGAGPSVHISPSATSVVKS